MATELHITRQTVSKWEQGTIEPNAQMIVQLAQRFDISTDELLTGETFHPYKREASQSYTEHLNFWDFLSQKWWFVLILVVIVCGTITQIFTS